MAKNKSQDLERQDAPEKVAEVEGKFAPVGYELLDPRIVSVSHAGVIYRAANGRIECTPEVAGELIAAGALKA